METPAHKMKLFVAVYLLIHAALGKEITFEQNTLYAECTDSNQCGKSECCVLGMERFSRPICHEMRGKGEMCSPYTSPISTMIAKPSPDEGYLNLTNVYERLCPCAPGLICSRGSSQCEEKVSNRKVIKKIRRTKS